MSASSASSPATGGAGRPVTFLHTGDWQLGMMRRFLGPEAQARFGQARIDAIERVARRATETAAAFVLVAGDVFDANQVDRQIVLRTCEALRAMPCPVYLLPGNHDAMEPGSVWASPTFRQHVPDHVEVLRDSEPRTPVPGVEVVGMPWRTRRPATDPLAAAGQLSPPASGTLRVLVGHGQVDALVPDVGDPALVRLADLESLLADGRAHYVALGDRHSLTQVGTSGRIWYAGAPEPTRPEEERPGELVRVELSADDCSVTALPIGTWHLVSRVVDLDGDADVDRLSDWFAEQPDKSRTVVRLGVRGTVSVAALTRLEMLLDAQAEVFAAIQRWRRHWDVRPRPDDAALDALPVAGPVRSALDELRTATGDGDHEAADALALLHRLVEGAA